jgi:hypothetical protein
MDKNGALALPIAIGTVRATELKIFTTGRRWIKTVP